MKDEIREQIEHRMDELAREYHRTHDEKVKDEIIALSVRLSELDTNDMAEYLTPR
jgi:hypothetical protein